MGEEGCLDSDSFRDKLKRKIAEFEPHLDQFLEQYVQWWGQQETFLELQRAWAKLVPDPDPLWQNIVRQLDGEL